MCFDAEVMPWSAKAQGLIDSLYRPVGEAGIAGTPPRSSLSLGRRREGSRLSPFGTLDHVIRQRRGVRCSWLRYVGPVAGIADLGGVVPSDGERIQCIPTTP